LDLRQGKELLIQSSQYGRCKRNIDVKEKMLLCFFCRFGKTLERVPGEVTRWALRKAGVEVICGECSHGNV